MIAMSLKNKPRPGTGSKSHRTKKKFVKCTALCSSLVQSAHTNLPENPSTPAFPPVSCGPALRCTSATGTASLGLSSVDLRTRLGASSLVEACHANCWPKGRFREGGTPPSGHWNCPRGRQTLRGSALKLANK